MVLTLMIPSEKGDPMVQERWLDQYGPTIQFKGMLLVS